MALSAAERLVNLGMPTELAKEVAALPETGGLQIGTTSTTAMAGNRTPTLTIRGGVLLQAAQVNSVAADTAAMVVDFNALLVKLRAAGIITP